MWVKGDCFCKTPTSAATPLKSKFLSIGVVGGNAPVAGADDSMETIRCTVETILDDASFGRFSLETTQVLQPSVFMPIALLQKAFEMEGRDELNGEEHVVCLDCHPAFASKIMFVRNDMKTVAVDLNAENYSR